MLVQKKQAKPIKLKVVKPEDMTQDAWSNMDELARFIIMLSMSKSVYYNVKDMVIDYDLRKKLCDLYEQKSASLQIYWLK